MILYTYIYVVVLGFATIVPLFVRAKTSNSASKHLLKGNGIWVKCWSLVDYIFPKCSLWLGVDIQVGKRFRKNKPIENRGLLQNFDLNNLRFNDGFLSSIATPPCCATSKNMDPYRVLYTGFSCTKILAWLFFFHFWATYTKPAS